MKGAVAAILVSLGALVLLPGTVFGQSKTPAPSADPVVEATAALDDLESWLGDSTSAAGWKNFLQLDSLRAQLAQGDRADLAAVGETLDQLESKTPGLDQPRFVRLRRAVAAWRRSIPPPQLADLPALARAEKEKYRPVDAPRLARARARLAAARDRLNGYLGKGAAGRGWRKFLKLESLDELLRPDAKPDPDAMVAIIEQLQADQVGLEQPVFTTLRSRLREYLADTDQAEDPKSSEEYASRLDQLAAQLDAYQKTPKPELLRSIGPELAWFERRGQALPLVAAVKRQLAQPNVLFTAKASFMADGLDRPVNDNDPVRDVILGTSIVGTGRTVGRLTFRFVPDTERALLRAELTGVNYSRSTGYNGPAVIYTTGNAQLKATKLLTVEADGLHGLSTTIDAKLSTRITGVGSTRRGIVGCIVTKVASRKAAQQSGATRAIAEQKANARLERKFETQIATELNRTNKQFKERFFGPLVRREIYPDLHFSTTTDRLNVVGLQGDTELLGAQNAPPEIVGDPDVAMRVHQSAVNNYTAVTFAGQTFGQPELEKLAIDMTGKVPDRLKSEDGKDDWNITFIEDEPITLRVEDGVVTLIGRAKRYHSNGRTYNVPMNFTVHYKVERAGKGFEAIRQGGVECLPPGFVPGGDRKLSTPQSTVRNLMAKRLDKMFDSEIVRPDPIELKDAWKKAGPLAMTHLSLAGGWISVGWNQDRPAANVAKAGGAATVGRADLSPQGN